MPRANALARKGQQNRRKSGPAKPQRRVNLPNLPEFHGPPPGTFDPGLEAQVRAAERGLYDLIDKTRREGRRESRDTREARQLLERKVRQGRADIARSKGYAIEDTGLKRQQYGIDFARDIEDLAIARQHGEEDYNKALTDMQHRYARIGAEQAQGSVARGTDTAGVEQASAAVRGANEAYDRGGLDTSHQRALSALGLDERRTNEDYGRRLGLLDTDLGRNLTDLGIRKFRLGQEGRTQRRHLLLDAFRNRQDRRTGLSQAKREYGIYATDVAQQAFYQAHQLNPHILFPHPAGTPGAPRPPLAPGRAAGVGTGGTRAPHNRRVGLGRRGYPGH